MSTWCAAKSLFLYYRKYLSEHICNRLLWEHIRGNLAHTTHSGGFMVRLQSIASGFCPPPLPHTSTENWFSPTCQHFQDLYTYGCGFSYCLSGFAERERDFLHVSFPPLLPCGKQAKVCLFARSWVWWMYLRRVPALLSSTTPSPFGSPWPLHTQPGILDPYGGPHALQVASRQLKLFQQSQLQCNAQGKSNSWQIPSPAFRYNVSSALRLS